MSIVKMKRLRLIAMQQSREELLKALQHAGCVEIAQPEEDGTDRWAGLCRPDSAALNEARDRHSASASALAAAKRYGPKTGMLAPRPTVEESRFFDDGAYADALALADRVNAAARGVQELQAEALKLETQQATVAPWRALDVPLDVASTRQVLIQLGTLPIRSAPEEFAAALTQAAPLSQIVPASSDSDAHYLLLLCHRSQEEEAAAVLREFGFAPAPLKGWTGTAEENHRAFEERQGQIREELARLEGELTELCVRKDELAACADRAALELRRQEAKSRLLDTQAAYYLEGWVPAEQADRLAAALEPFLCAWELSDPGEEDYPSVPVKLKNNWFTRPLNMVTEMYVLPAYDGVDPNPFMAPFFILFFGMMMADMAYGLLMAAAGWYLLKKLRAKGGMRNTAGLLVLCGITSFVFGALTGGFLGDFIPQLVSLIDPSSSFALPSVFSPLDDALMVLIGSLALGVIQIITGMLISAVRKCAAGRWCDALWDEGTWFAILGGIALMALGVGNVAGWPVLLVVGCVMLVIGSGRGAKGFGKVTALVGAIYNGVTGYFSDILSYARLMALMLAGAVIAQVFNTLGTVTGNAVTFVLISLIGNALNFALNLLSCFVHDLRLQCLEFFNRFYKEGGKAFRPLSTDTKYVDLN